MPKPIIGSNIIIAERLIAEDNIFTAVRLADLYTLRQVKEIPLNKQGVDMQVLVQIKGQIGDEEEHRVKVLLIRPSGEVQVLLEKSIAITSTVVDTPGGANLRLNIGVVPKELGVHYIALDIDEKEVNRCPFTLRLDELKG